MKTDSTKRLNKNKKLLDGFVKYCAKHPEQRFWQALRNWAGVLYIFTKDDTYNPNYNLNNVFLMGLVDTFYLEGKPEKLDDF